MTNIDIVNLVTTAHTDVRGYLVHDQGVYCFQSAPDKLGGQLKDDQGRIIYLPLNRKYKPIGETTKQWVDYRDYVDTHGMVFECDPYKIGDVWDKGSNELVLYVFDDDVPASRNDYAKNMRTIMAYARPYNGKLH
jgi:hypothetical protein